MNSFFENNIRVLTMARIELLRESSKRRLVAVVRSKTAEEAQRVPGCDIDPKGTYRFGKRAQRICAIS